MAPPTAAPTEPGMVATLQTTPQRRFTRIAFHSSVALVLGDRRLKAKLQDLSLKGALIAVGDASGIAVDDPFVLEIRLDGPGAAITMHGHVARIDADQLGLQGGLIDLDSMTRLRRLLELNLGDAELVHRELAALWETRPG